MNKDIFIMAFVFGVLALVVYATSLAFGFEFMPAMKSVVKFLMFIGIITLVTIYFTNNPEKK